jgi:alpha-galactosidase
LSAAKGDLSGLSQIGWSVSNSWRTSIKVIDDPWQNVKASFLLNNNHATTTRPGWLNDPDLLAVGLKQLTPNEERTQFALWAISKAPLLISADLSQISSNSLAILKNKALIAVN